MRLISFALTTPQFLDGSKTVTRRDGWEWLKPGTLLGAVRKGQGLKKGEKVDRLGVIEVVSVRRESIDAITDEDVVREGFPGRRAEWFVRFYRRAARNLVDPCPVTRIRFRSIVRIQRFPRRAEPRIGSAAAAQRAEDALAETAASMLGRPRS